jgi:hypothetical protein
MLNHSYGSFQSHASHITKSSEHELKHTDELNQTLSQARTNSNTKVGEQNISNYKQTVQSSTSFKSI